MVDRPVIANLDFNEIKNDLVEHFKSKDEFTDYEFTGSALNLLMDILSYNTHYYSLASNFLLNESFLDTAVIRKNVVSIAKRLNYTPRSVKSASTVLTLQFTKQSENDNVIIIPAGSLFRASTGAVSLNFHTVEDYVLQFNTAAAVGSKKTIDVTIHEGNYKTQAFVSSDNYSGFSTWELKQDNIDTSTITVSVNGTRYKVVLPEDEGLFNVTSASNVYYLEENRNGGYNIIFGDGIAGKAINNGDQIIVSYLTSSGPDGNGVKKFSPNINSRTDVVILGTPEPTQGGGERETIQSIKDNAPKWFQSQYRAVTTNDYEALLVKKYADIQAINVYGGEEVGYPGKVFICIKPKSAKTLTQATKEILKSQILTSSKIVTVRPEFVDPNIFKVGLQTVVVYDKNKLSSSRNLLEAKIQNLFKYLNENYIGDFLKSFRESNLSYEIRNIDQSVISSNTRVSLSTEITSQDGFLDQYEFRFNNKLYHPNDGFLGDKGGILTSTPFYRVGRNVQSAFDEDGYGNIRLYDFVDNKKVYVNRKAGRIDYQTGLIEFLYDFDPEDSVFDITVIPESVDIIANQNMILEVDLAKSSVDAVEIKETDLLRNINLSRSF